jgi:hypothetical protein
MSEGKMSDDPQQQFPGGEYAIVELFGHTTLVGRILEVERFGTKMLAIEPLFNGSFLPAVLHGGAAIYRLTPCSAAVAHEKQPMHAWALPPAIRAIVPPDLLPVSSVMEVDQEDTSCAEDDDHNPF